MKVVNKDNATVNYLKFDDIAYGEVFRFLGNTTQIYLCSVEDTAVNIETGEVLYIYSNVELENKPVERINCHLIIE